MMEEPMAVPAVLDPSFPTLKALPTLRTSLLPATMPIPPVMRRVWSFAPESSPRCSPSMFLLLVLRRDGARSWTISRKSSRRETGPIPEPSLGKPRPVRLARVLSMVSTRTTNSSPAMRLRAWECKISSVRRFCGATCMASSSMLACTTASRPWPIPSSTRSIARRRSRRRWRPSVPAALRPGRAPRTRRRSTPSLHRDSSPRWPRGRIPNRPSWPRISCPTIVLDRCSRIPTSRSTKRTSTSSCAIQVALLSPRGLWTMTWTVIAMTTKVMMRREAQQKPLRILMPMMKLSLVSRGPMTTTKTGPIATLTEVRAMAVAGAVRTTTTMRLEVRTTRKLRPLNVLLPRSGRSPKSRQTSLRRVHVARKRRPRPRRISCLRQMTTAVVLVMLLASALATLPPHQRPSADGKRLVSPWNRDCRNSETRPSMWEKRRS
mmetsp:Transcript_31105/g.91063  ORF Transcript_31105/g.91063 Transcript_31105/m.91063 type:complete len:434 (-) Transcript_31105:2028-3329(-)